MSPRIGSLFSGYGGLDMGVTAAVGGSVAWHVEYDKAPSKILAHHWPDVPNYGDVTAVDWSAVEPVDIVTGGSPCQDLSHAGKRQGMTEGTRSNLWVAMREAIAQLRPSMVVWENVRGAYSAAADSELESCAGCVGDGSGVYLRALGRVLGDLSDLGYDCRWHGLRAADIGAPHGRFRVFVVAYASPGGHESGRRHELAQSANWRIGPADCDPRTLLPTPTASDGHGPGAHGNGGLDLRTAVSLLPTPTTQDGANNAGPSQFDRNSLPLNAAVTLLPTPAVNDMGEGKTVEACDEWTAKMQAAHGNGNGHGKSLAIEAQRLACPNGPNCGEPSRADVFAGRWCACEARRRLLPTPMVGSTSEAAHGQISGDYRAKMAEALQNWGQYADAIARWEALTRPAPAPTQPSKKGTPQLSPAFSEWLMGLPAGHVTGVPGLSRNDMLKALGNGVVPQQAEAALRFLLGGVAVPTMPRPPALFDTPDTAPDAPNTGSNRKSQVAGLGNQVRSLAGGAA